jgi:diguanylate cyclase (GGDEF)-like protein
VAQRRALEAKLSYQAFHDPLTGLTNRRRFVQQAEEALAREHLPGSVAALFLDLDDFKTVNDSLGHQAGDDVLVAVGTRIRESLRERDLAARLGGDEFGVLLVDIPDPVFAATVSDRLLAKLDAPIEIAGTKVMVGASIGIAIDNPTMSSVDDLLGEADVAMYQAKALGKGRHQIFSPEALAGAEAAAPPTVAEGERRPWHVRRPIVGRPDIRPTSLEPEAG